MAKNKIGITFDADLEKRNREELRKIILSSVEHPKRYLEYETLRIAYWRQHGVLMPDNGRVIFSKEEVTDFLLHGLKNIVEPSHEGDTTGGLELVQTWLDIKCNHIDDSILKRMEWNYQHPTEWIPDDLLLFNDKDNCPGHNREKPERIVFSVALEDMFFVSDYSSYTSCYKTYEYECASGAGRGMALADNTFLVFREDNRLVPHNYYRVRQDCDNTFSLPFLPKRLGRRWGYTVGDQFLFHREYGTCKWALLVLSNYIEQVGDMRLASGFASGYAIRYHTTNIEVYLDSSPLAYNQILTRRSSISQDIDVHAEDNGIAPYMLWFEQEGELKEIQSESELSIDRVMCSSCGEYYNREDTIYTEYIENGSWRENNHCVDCHHNHLNIQECSGCGAPTSDGTILDFANTARSTTRFLNRTERRLRRIGGIPYINQRHVYLRTTVQAPTILCSFCVESGEINIRRSIGVYSESHRLPSTREELLSFYQEIEEWAELTRLQLAWCRREFGWTDFPVNRILVDNASVIFGRNMHTSYNSLTMQDILDKNYMWVSFTRFCDAQIPPEQLELVTSFPA